MTVLMTGFAPFGGETVNPALEAIKKLEGRQIAGVPVVTRALPVVRFQAIESLKSAIREVDPSLIVAVGQAGGRMEITPERIAINVDDYRIRDNDGNQPVDEPVEKSGPAGYWSSLPIKAMVEQMRRQGIPASVSNSAGTFVCNHLFYGLMHVLALEGNKRRGGFIHIPYLPEQAAQNPGQPSMGLDTIVRGLEICLEAALTVTTDQKWSMGTIC
jgi:pyroglutamyl-peptidase I